MVTNDGFQPDRPPIFLSEHAEETGQPDIGKAQDIAIISSRILKTSMLAATVTAVGIAVLSMGNPATLVANVTDWWVDKPALQPEADPPTPPVQSIASTRDLPTTTTDAPTREETVAAVEPAEQRQEPAGQSQEPARQSQEPAKQSQEPAERRQAEIGQPITEALFQQFQAWADAEDARAKAGAQPAPVRVAQEAPAPVRSTKKQRRVRSVQNARAEIRSQRNHRAKLREEQDAQGQAPIVSDPRLQDPSAQNAQTPSFLQSLGLRN
jgi:hypothetical protein